MTRSSILKSAQHNTEKLKKEKGGGNILRVRAVPSLSLFLMGSMDWLTTIIGIAYFGAVEGNPFLADVVSTSLPAFTAIKLSTTIIIAFLFHKADKMLLKTQDKTTRSFRYARLMLRGTYIMATALLLFAVLNNLLVVVQAF
jgi:hypothetical protein